MTDHVCGCEYCDATLDPTGPREDGDHYSVRFGDWNRAVYNDGELVTEAVEVHAGPNGRALLVSQPIHLCRRGHGNPEHVCLHWTTGNFEVR